MKDYSRDVAFSPEKWTEFINKVSMRVKRRIEKEGFRVSIIETDHDIYLSSFEIDIYLFGKPDSAGKQTYAFDVSANFRDDVKSKRIPKYDLPEGGVTWNRSMVGFETRNKLDQALIKAVDELTETFVNALLFENGGEMEKERNQHK